jgi:hypothetical protein
MRKFLTVIILLSSLNLYSQTILNGDFEDNTANECKYNISNEQFNSYIKNCFAFGLGNELDIQKDTTNSSSNTLGQFNEPLGKTSPCSYSIPASGKYFISLSSARINKPDALSLKLSSEYIQNNQYKISFSYRNYLNFVSDTDSLFFGVSNDSSKFGETIYKLYHDTQLTWVNTTFTFTSPINAKYITVKNKGDKKGWNFIDNIKSYILTNTHNFYNKDINIYPNPTDKEINLVSESLIQNGTIVIYNLLGKEVKTLNNLFGNKFIVESQDLPTGQYIIHLLDNNKNILNKKININH